MEEKVRNSGATIMRTASSQRVDKELIVIARRRLVFVFASISTSWSWKGDESSLLE